jgi:hypothetical protein
MMRFSRERFSHGKICVGRLRDVMLSSMQCDECTMMILGIALRKVISGEMKARALQLII